MNNVLIHVSMFKAAKAVEALGIEATPMGVGASIMGARIKGKVFVMPGCDDLLLFADWFNCCVLTKLPPGSSEGIVIFL